MKRLWALPPGYFSDYRPIAKVAWVRNQKPLPLSIRIAKNGANKRTITWRVRTGPAGLSPYPTTG
jgi:hypothetical protein